MLLYITSEQSGIKKSSELSFTIAEKNMKYLGINLSPNAAICDGKTTENQKTGVLVLACFAAQWL